MLRDPDPSFVAGVGPSRRNVLRGGLSRRNVLRGGAALASGLFIGIELPLPRARADEPVPTGARFNAFIHVAADDTVTFTLPAVEMGQGVYTSQAQCLAEELDIGLDKVIATHAPPDQANYGSPVFIIQATGGSTTTIAWTGPLRKAGATARAMLVQAAAAKWGVDPSGLNDRERRHHGYGEWTFDPLWRGRDCGRRPPPARGGQAERPLAVPPDRQAGAPHRYAR